MLARSKSGSGLKAQCWRLDKAGRTLVLAAFDGGLVGLVHFGAPLPANEDLEALARMKLVNVTGGQLDPVVPNTLFPSVVDGWQGRPGIRHRDRARVMIARPTSNEVVEDVFSCNFEIFDAASNAASPGGVQNEPALMNAVSIGGLAISITDHGLLHVQFHLEEDYTYRDDHYEWLAASIPVPDHLPRIIDHRGRWCGEFQRQECSFSAGSHARESYEGRTGHSDFPGMVFAAGDCSEHRGECLGVTLKWSGGWRAIAEELPDGRRHVQMGHAVNGDADHYEVLVGWSDEGFNGLSHQFHAEVRDSSPMPSKRLVHYNCWEAVYFRHSIDELKEIASRARALGAERFVLDDGWFRGRNDDTTSLGDWVVDQEKYPDGLHPLVEHVQSLGMDFGLWFEPEMVNMDSDLYREHPEWVLGGRHQPSGRNQHVLNLSKAGVHAYLFEGISDLLDAYPISYIKWDHNRILPLSDPAQPAALYKLLEQLNHHYPHVEIETCASGGGRIDFGILDRTNRVWLSDSNDALVRISMQHEASRWLPPEIQGSHVGPRLCHTSGRTLPMAFRAWVASMRHMGMEMDPREVTEDEALVLSSVTAWYQDNRDFLFSSDLFRLGINDPEVLAEAFIAPDRSRFILYVGQLGPSSQNAVRAFQIPQLEQDGIYSINCANPEIAPVILNRNQGLDADCYQTVHMSGAALGAGLFRPPNLFPQSILVYEGTLIK